MSARVSELLIFSFLLPVGPWGVVRALRRDRTWVAAAVVWTAACVFSIVTTLRGYTLMGGGHYGIDHRRPREVTTAGQVVLAVLAALLPVVAWLVVRARRRP
ncbi:hypothetical protein ACVW00_002782 [Marmoricola sp. URHA0025 HA25]